jgi:hypothetical protein
MASFSEAIAGFRMVILGDLQAVQFEQDWIEKPMFIMRV